MGERAATQDVIQSCIILINYKPLCDVSMPSKAAHKRHFFSVPAYPLKLFATKQVHRICTTLAHYTLWSCFVFSKFRVQITAQSLSILNILVALSVSRDKFHGSTSSYTTTSVFHIVSSSLLTNYQRKIPVQNGMASVLQILFTGPICSPKRKCQTAQR